MCTRLAPVSACVNGGHKQTAHGLAIVEAAHNLGQSQHA